MNQNPLEKEITIANLSQRSINPKPGQTWKPFVVYQIQSTEGITYETTDRQFYSDLKLNQPVKIKYNSETKTVNGKVYTSHKIVLPQRANPGMEKLREDLFKRIDLMEKNILSAIQLSLGEPKLVYPDESVDQGSKFKDNEIDQDFSDEDEPPY